MKYKALVPTVHELDFFHPICAMPFVSQVKGTAVHFWAWGTEQPRLKCHAPEKLGPLAVSGESRDPAAAAIRAVSVVSIQLFPLLARWPSLVSVRKSIMTACSIRIWGDNFKKKCIKSRKTKSPK